MRIVQRVSVFFLVALAIVLSLYSVAFYYFVQARLVRQFEQELQAAISSLVAAVEVEPEEVKWQPLEHTVAMGAIQHPDEVQWIIIGDQTQVVDQSRNASPAVVAIAKEIATRFASDVLSEDHNAGHEWRYLARRVAAPSPERSQRELDEFDEIVVVVVRSVVPLNTDLNRLRLLVCILPVGVWSVAAAAGHWFCRRALQPVLEMAHEARVMTGADFKSRLPVSAAGDELSELAVAFNTLLDRQHQVFEQQRRFTGDAAHELRTPLTVLLGEIEVTLRRSRSPEEYARTLNVLRAEAIELQEIVESLLFLARAENDALQPRAEAVDLVEWLPLYMQRWGQHPRSADLQLRTNGFERGVVRASTSLLTRLLDNLLENALKYSDAGTLVEVELTGGLAGAVIAVADQGMGIDAEDISKVFDPFFRSRSARNAGIAGTGLGLSIALRIATALGGRLTCASELHRGTCFTLSLPPADAQDSSQNPHRFQ